MNITPLTWAKLQQLKLRKQSLKRRGFVFLCSVIYHTFWLYLFEPSAGELLCFLAEPLPLSCTFPLCMALPRMLLLRRGPVMAPWSQTAELHPQLEVQLPPVQAHSFLGRAGTAAQLRLTGAALCSLHHSSKPKGQGQTGQGSVGRLSSTPVLLSGCPSGLVPPTLLALTVPPLLQPPPYSHCTPGTAPLWGSYSIHFSSSFLWPFTSQAAGFF